MSLLHVDNIHTFYGKIEALKGISLTVEPGQIVTLIGANGAGKSTTLNTIGGITPATAGSIILEGENITHLPPHQIVTRGVVQSPEGRKIFTRLTVRENLEMGAFTRTSKAEVERDMDYIFTRLPRLKERAWQLGGTLSGGEQQMLAIGRALMLRPKLMLLDEPSFGLAPLVVQEMFEILRTLNRQEKVSMFLVEQNAALALDLADHAYLLETGRVVMAGPAREIREDEGIRRSYLGY